MSLGRRGTLRVAPSTHPRPRAGCKKGLGLNPHPQSKDHSRPAPTDPDFLHPCARSHRPGCVPVLTWARHSSPAVSRRAPPDPGVGTCPRSCRDPGRASPPLPARGLGTETGPAEVKVPAERGDGRGSDCGGLRSDGKRQEPRGPRKFRV